MNGSMAGSSTRLPLLNTSSGRLWFSPSRVRPTRLTSGRILDRDQVTFCWDGPTDKNIRVEREAFRTLVLERLRLPLNVTDTVCECGVRLASLGEASRCMSTLCQVAHKSSANGTDIVEVRADDERAIEVVASGLPIHQGRNWLWTSHCSPLTFWRSRACRWRCSAQGSSGQRHQVCGASPREPVPLGLVVSVWRLVAGGVQRR